MFRMRVCDAVTTLVEAWFPRPRGEGLLVMLDLRLEHPKRDWEKACSNLSFVFERPTKYGSCRTFAGITEKGFDLPELNQWTMESNHDSCWKDAVGTAIVQEYFRLAKIANDKMAPANLREWAHIHRVQPVSLAWEVDPEKAKERRDDYFKRLTKLEMR